MIRTAAMLTSTTPKAKNGKNPNCRRREPIRAPPATSLSPSLLVDRLEGKMNIRPAHLLRMNHRQERRMVIKLHNCCDRGQPKSRNIDIWDAQTGKWSLKQLNIGRDLLACASVAHYTIFAGLCSGRTHECRCTSPLLTTLQKSIPIL